MPTRNFFLADIESKHDGTDWPMVSYTFDDTDGIVEILRRLPNGYQMILGSTDGDNWRTICTLMAKREETVTQNVRMRDWFKYAYHGGSYSSLGSFSTFDMWTKSDMVHVIATLWMVMYDQSITLSGDTERAAELREWAESLYSAIAETLHVDLV